MVFFQHRKTYAVGSSLEYPWLLQRAGPSSHVTLLPLYFCSAIANHFERTTLMLEYSFDKCHEPFLILLKLYVFSGELFHHGHVGSFLQAACGR